MTAAERATDAALAGAAEHRAEQQRPAEGARVDVTYRDCTVRRVSPGLLRTTWVTLETPAGIILDFDLGEQSIEIRPSGERAVAAAEPEPGVLVLPDGWEKVDYTDDERGECSFYQCGSGRSGGPVHAVVDVDGISISAGPACDIDEARILAARLVEAAGIVEQLRAGVR